MSVADLLQQLLSVRPGRRPGQGRLNGVDLLVLDSLARHMPRLANGEVAAEAMEGLKQIAENFSIGLVLVAHFTKGGEVSVERWIGGAGVIENLAKAIFVFGPRPRHRSGPITIDQSPLNSEDHIKILACERMGLAPRPPSIEYRIETRYLEATHRPEPYLVRLGETSSSADDVFSGLQQRRGTARGREGRMHETAVWILDALEQEGPMPTRRLIAGAKEHGVFFSDNTFERARRIADVDPGVEGLHLLLRDRSPQPAELPLTQLRHVLGVPRGLLSAGIRHGP